MRKRTLSGLYVLALWLMLMPLVQAQELIKQRISTNGTVYSLLRRGDSTFVGGSFYEAGYYSSRVALTSPTNDFPDSDFPMTNGEINDIEPDGAGGWYLGGSFSQVNGQTLRYLAHVLPNKTVDPNFNPNPNSTVYTLLRRADSLYVGGSFSEIAGQAIPYAAQLRLSNGGQAGSWQPNPNGVVYSLAYGPGNSIYVGGSFTRIGGKNQRYFAEMDAVADSLISNISVNSTVYDILATGNEAYLGGTFSESGHYSGRVALVSKSSDFPDNRFPEFNSTVERVIADGNGGWYVSGSFNTVNGQQQRNIAHVLGDFSVDPAFNPDPNGVIYAMHKSGNLLYVGGGFTQIGGQGISYAAVIDLSNNTVQSSWQPQPSSSVYSIFRDDSLVFLGGSFTSLGGKRQRYFGKVSAATGALRPTISVNSTVYSMDKANGLVYLGGGFSEGGYYAPYAGLVSTSSADVPDVNFPAANSTVYTVIPDGNGGWYMGGSFSVVGGQNVSRLAHILADKTVDPNFNPAPNSTVNALLLSGNVLYAGGSFTQIGGQTVGRVAALDVSTGQILSGWLTALPIADNSVEALAIDGTTLYIGGSFANINSQPYARLAALNAANGAVLAFNPGANSTVYGLIIDGSSLYVGGGFSQIAGQSRSYLAAVDKSTGALVSAFNPNANSSVYSVESRGGFLYVGGSFTQAGGQPRNYLAQLSLTNGAATTWNGNANSTVYSFKNGYAGGAFTQVGGQPRRYAAQINDNGTLNAWNPDVDSYVYGIAQNGNEVVLGGSFQNFRQRSRSYLAAFSFADNRLSDSWTASANSTVYAVRLRDASYLYVGGAFSQAGGQPRNGVAEINAQSGLASTWNPNVSGTVYDLQAVADSIFVIGSFTQAGGQTRKYAAAFLNTNHSTSTLLPWNPQINSSGYTLSIAGNRILLGGPFSYLKHVDNNYLLALDKPSKLVLPWKPNPNTTVYSLTLDGSKLYVAGSYTQIGGQPRKGLVRYDVAPAAANTLDVAWNASFTGKPYCL